MARALHFDCFSGLSGDMTLGALIDLGVDLDAIRDGVDSLGLPIRLEAEKVVKGGFAATRATIEAPEEKHHRFLPEIEEIIDRGRLTASQKKLALQIFHRLAQAEAEAHGMPVERVHFHEVGALDSIADIVGVAIGLDLLKVETITSRSVPTGTGMVKCAHGLMPIPTPATAILLRGVPLAATSIRGELTTPTGAAILTTVVHSWVESPGMTVDRIGSGAGTRELLEQPNLLRLFLGNVSTGERVAAKQEEKDSVWLLETNLDDVPGEVVGFCFETLLQAGALDVFTIPIQMKKNRPGVILSLLAKEADIEKMEGVLFRETATLGVRRVRMERSILKRESISVETRWGSIAGKRGWRSDGGLEIFSPEYEACARIARERGIALRDVYGEVQQAFVRGKS